jgi:hypothetical protein
MNIKKKCFKQTIIVAIIAFLTIQISVFGNDNFSLGPYAGLYSQTMGEKTNFGFRSGLEIKIKDHYLFIPKIRFNLSNESEKVFGEKIVLLQIDYFSVAVPRFEFGFDLGYTYKIMKFLSPYLTAGLTFGTYNTPHSIIYDQYGVQRGEVWVESRLLGIPISIGNYFEMTNSLIIKGYLHSTNYRNIKIIGSSSNDERNESQEIHRGNSFGGGIDIVYFIIPKK